MTSKRDLIQSLLKSIETGDPEAATVVDEARYIQHNPRTSGGSKGLSELFARLVKIKPRVTLVRVIEEGDFGFAHNEYNFDGMEAALEVFRFEDGKAVEYWDNIQRKQPPHPAGGKKTGPEVLFRGTRKQFSDTRPGHDPGPIAFSRGRHHCPADAVT